MPWRTRLTWLLAGLLLAGGLVTAGTGGRQLFITDTGRLTHNADSEAQAVKICGDATGQNCPINAFVHPTDGPKNKPICSGGPCDQLIEIEDTKQLLVKAAGGTTGLIIDEDEIEAFDLLQRGSDPADPASGRCKLYVKSTGAFVRCAGASVVGPLIATPTVSAASRLLGRGSAGGAGAMEEITLGTNLSLSGTTLNAAGGVTDISVSVRRSALLAVANATETVVPFDVEEYDTDTMHSTVTNTSRLTFTTAGKYLVTCRVRWAVNATGKREITLKLNGTTHIEGEEGPGSAASALSQAVTRVYSFAAADYVELFAEQSSGGSLNLELATGSKGPMCQAHKVN